MHKNIVLAGDFNTIMTNDDVYDWEKFVDNALFKEPVKQRLKAIEYLGFYDAFRTINPSSQGYTFWDYMANAWQVNHGMRIDYVYLSPALCDKLVYCEVDKNPRKSLKPSDHTPLVVGLRQ
jgi:exodeoxyribonuclease-3